MSLENPTSFTTSAGDGFVAMDGLIIGGSSFPVLKGIVYYVDGANGDDLNNGRSLSFPFETIQAAVTASSAGDTVLIAPGAYDEAVTIARAKSNLTIRGVGGRGAAFIETSTTNATGLTNEADDVTIINVGCAGDGTGSGLINRGSRLRAYGSKFEGGDIAITMTLGTVAQEAAGTHGVGADCMFIDCETAWTTTGVKLIATDYGAVTQLRFRDCNHHDHSAAAFEESGGSVDIRFRDLDIGRCVFPRQEDGSEPTAYILLNDDNGNKGIVWGCTFPSALAGGKNLVSTGLIWTGNFHTGGISTGQPS